MGNGFKYGNLYGSWCMEESINIIGVDIGIMNIPNAYGDKVAKTFTIAIKISHFCFAIGYIIKEL